MIITCPSCSKKYLIEDTAVTNTGRTVKCAYCFHQWYFVPTTAKTIDPVDLSHLSSAGALAQPSLHRHLLWMSLVSLLTILVMAFYFLRQPLMSYFPSLKAIYSLVGMSGATTSELTIEKIEPFFESDGAISIKGSITNKTKKTLDLKPLTVAVTGDCDQAPFLEKIKAKLLKTNGGQCVLASWTFSLKESRVFPQEHIAFETKINQAIPGSKGIHVKF
jgi:predicted Zn finger-like uncharacterized protein